MKFPIVSSLNPRFINCIWYFMWLVWKTKKKKEKCRKQQKKKLKLKFNKTKISKNVYNFDVQLKTKNAMIYTKKKKSFSHY